MVGAAVVAGLFVWDYASKGSRLSCIGAGLAGILGIATAEYDRRRVDHAGSLIQVGWGLNLVSAASLGLVVMAFVLASSARRPAPPEIGSATPSAPAEARANVSAVASDVASRLEQLNELRERGLISDEELAAKRTEILDQI